MMSYMALLKRINVIVIAQVGDKMYNQISIKVMVKNQELGVMYVEKKVRNE